MLEQAFMQVSEVPVRMTRGRHAFVNLYQMHAVPRDPFLGQGSEHHPRSVSTADRHDEASALSHCGSSLCSYNRGSFSCYRFSICKYFDFHGNILTQISRYYRLMPAPQARLFDFGNFLWQFAAFLPS